MMGSYELVGKAVSTWDTGEHAGLGVSFESNQIWYAAQVVHVFLGSGRGLGVYPQSFDVRCSRTMELFGRDVVGSFDTTESKSNQRQSLLNVEIKSTSKFSSHEQEKKDYNAVEEV
ncbi:hypothetical protein IAQ61_003062 [Plenodomus lingam]|uniref:uncharacterized protein n=1 Tax=Leptosphaeria maculans TaxID=5022 RepID=UPI0033339237|nr:hypothetical protein IAQ61_003062 [Plenodomus lingam]